MPINITDIVTEYRNYYLKSGQNLSRVKAALMQPDVTLQQFGTRMYIEDTVYQMANPIYESLVQPFRKNFEAKGEVEFVPNKIELNHLKVDLSLYPHDIEASWFGFLAGDNSKKLEDWPIVRYMLEEYLAKQVLEDKELHAVYKGEYNATGNTPISSLDGLKKKLVEAANNTKYPLNVISGINPFSAVSILDQIEKYDEKINSLYTSAPLIHFLAPKWVRLMKKDKRAKGYYFIDSADKINDTIDFTNHVVVALPSMSGTDDIFTTVKQNLFHLVKRPNNYNAMNVDVQKADRQIKILVDWWEAVGFGCNKLIWTTSETIGNQSSGSGS